MSADNQLQDLLDQYAQQASLPSNPNTTPATPTPVSENKSSSLPDEMVEAMPQHAPDTEVLTTSNPNQPSPQNHNPEPPSQSPPIVNIPPNTPQSPPPSTSVVPPPPTNPTTPSSYSVPLAPPLNFFKLTFYISLIIFLAVFGYLGYKIYLGEVTINFASNQASNVSIKPTAIPTPVLANCFLNDQTLRQGDTFPATDGCNTCTCNSDATITCTDEACESDLASVPKAYSHTSIPKFQLSYPSDWVYYKYSSSLDTLYFEPSADLQDGETREVPLDTEPPLVPLVISIIDTTKTQTTIKQNKQDYKYSNYIETSPTVNGVKSAASKGVVEAEGYLTGLVDHHLYIPRGSKTIHLNYIELDADINESVWQEIVNSLTW